MENILRQKYKLPKSAARSIVAEAKSSLKLRQDVTYSKPLEQKCVKIAEDRGFLENGKPIEKKPARTTWVPSQPTMKATDLRSRVTQILAQEPPPSGSQESVRQAPSSPTRTPVRKPERKPERKPVVKRHESSDSPRKSKPRESSNRQSSSSHDRTLHKPVPNDRPRRSRFVPSARVSRVLDPIAEASYSTDESSVGSATSRRSRRRLRRNFSSETQSTCSSGITTVDCESSLREHILRIVGDCTEIDVVSDHAKGFRATDFDSRSYTSLTVSTDGESVSSSGSGWQWSASPRKAAESRNSVSMGPATVKSLAMRFSSGASDQVAAPPRPVRRHSNDDDDHRPLPPPIRVLGEPPIKVVETPARIITSYS